MKIKEELETNYSDFTIERIEENFEVDLKNFEKEFNTDVKFYETIKSEPLEINIEGEPIYTNNTNGFTIWTHSDYKVERDIKKEVTENCDVKHGIKSECKVDLKKLKIEVKTEDCKQVVHVPDDNEQVMPVNNEFCTPDENSNKSEMKIQMEEEEQIQEYFFQHNSQTQQRYKYKMKTKKYVPSNRKCKKLHNKIKRKYFRIMFSSHSKQIFSCYFCKLLFANKTIFQTHLFCHIGKKPFRCTTCNKKFLWQFLLLRHMKEHKSVNENEISYKNLRMHPSGNRVNLSPRNGKKSNIKRKNVFCDICGKGVSKGHLERHKRIHRTHACEICGKEFKLNGILLSHKLVHSEDRPFKCHICNKSFKSKNHVRNHQKTHSEDRPFKCNICNKSFKSIYHAKSHQETHSEKRRCKCDICNKSFKSIGILKRHKTTTHREERSFKCDICNKGFNLKYQLKMHHKTHSDERNFSCQVCNKSYKTKQNLELHKLVHDNQFYYTCQVCNKIVKGNIARHKRIHIHHICKICGKEFKSNYKLMDHEVTHSEDRPFKCDICNKSFKRKKVLKTHHETHNDELKYICQVCNKRFKTKHYLRHHKVVHNDEFNYTCQVCNKRFKRNVGLKRHVNIHSDEYKYF
ncbi:zinc finger protein 708-like [Centruroides sculpturatus]|uniref:zinc finger protein 708-like n=1 Tax=Centruroides sculpturatus TaxID=218467 RepID=UPI000C6D8B45|nr:zinc finger protein 708-like [Centruroides sculpturatus]